MPQGFETESVRIARSTILETLADNHRFILVEGASGTGKSFLKEQLRSKLDQRYQLVDIPYSRFDVDELLETLAETLKLEYESGDSDSCFAALQRRFQQQERVGRPVALVIDDAQFIPDETLVSLAKSIEGDNPLLPLRGVLFATPGVHKKLLFNHLSEKILSQHLQLPAASETEMNGFIQYQLSAQSHRPIAIDEEAMQGLLIAAAGSLRSAKQLVSLALIEAGATGQSTITDAIIERIQNENCFSSPMPFSDTEDTETADMEAHDLLPHREDSNYDPTLGGLLTKPLLDTPEKPQLKHRSEDVDVPLFINDLAAAQISSEEALHAHTKTPPQSTTASIQQAIQPSEVADQFNGRPTVETESAQLANESGESTAAPSIILEDAPINKSSVEANVEAATASEDPPLPPELNEPASAPILIEEPAPKSQSGSKTVFWLMLIAILVGGVGYLQLAQKPGFEPQQLIAKFNQLISGTPSSSAPTMRSEADSEGNREVNAVAVSHPSDLNAKTLDTNQSVSLERPVEDREESEPAIVENKSLAAEQPSTQDISRPTIDSNDSRLTAEPDTTTESVPSTQENSEEQIVATSSPVNIPTTVVAPAVKSSTNTENQLQITDLQVNHEINPSREDEQSKSLENIEREMLTEDRTDIDKALFQNPVSKSEEIETNSAPVVASNNETPESIKAAKNTETILSEASNATATDGPVESPSVTPATEEQTSTSEEDEFVRAADKEAFNAELEALQAQIKVLVQQAKIHEKAYRLTIPENNNAVLTYRKILALQANNTVAAEGIARITERYHTRAEQAVRVGNWGVAAQNYSRLLWMNPDNEEVSAAVSQMQERMNGN